MDNELWMDMQSTMKGIESDDEGESWARSGYLATQMFVWFPILIAEVQRLREALGEPNEPDPNERNERNE